MRASGAMFDLVFFNVNVNVNISLAISDQDFVNCSSGEPGPQAMGVTHPEVPPQTTSRNS